ncbi:hypothetical protein KW460_20270 [Vibrio fluvialis]|nr:hypothetical protein [Vibrio fluvialis]MBY7771161.1 hypothetical protein [Vibrio fluvialis]MBY7839382.1 hypothetical protein [Vibrio fluvialis]MBY7873473.1 hypothetical protein [Vibrio fluvialis]MBY7890384.1 hypothetical protein [Vibrio fluvialis]
MSKEFILMLHPTFGVLALIAAVWVFVDTLNATDTNSGRIRNMSVLVSVLMWLTYIAGGYWYVVFYGGEKAIIKQGPWPFSHSFYMEMKEHIFLMLLLLSTYLPIVAWNDIVNQLPSRKLLLWTSAIVIVLSLVMEGAGAIISMGVKVSLLASQ